MPRTKKTETAAKTTAKKPTAAQPAAEPKKAVRKTCKTSVNLELNGLSVSLSDVQNAVKKAVKEQGLEATELNIYVNTTEAAAYYTVNGEGGSAYKVDLKTL